jgi:hypothetical protein
MTMDNGAVEEHTYFSHKERLFPDLVDGNIETEQFLSACEGLANFVGGNFINFIVYVVIIKRNYYVFRNVGHGISSIKK